MKIVTKTTAIALIALGAFALPALAGSTPNPVDGTAKGVVKAGQGTVDGVGKVGGGVVKAGDAIAEDTKTLGPLGLVTGAVKGAGEIAKGTVEGVVNVTNGAVQGAGCIATAGTVCD